jgi:hypothetical protein
VWSKTCVNSFTTPSRGVNSSLEGNVRRAIDIREGEKINEAAFKQLIRAAAAANSSVLDQLGAIVAIGGPHMRSEHEQDYL